MDLGKKFETLDKFYIVLSLVLLLMSVLLIFSFRGVFSMFITGYDIDPNSIAPGARVNRDRLSQAYEFAFSKNVVHLEMTSPPPVVVKDKTKK